MPSPQAITIMQYVGVLFLRLPGFSFRFLSSYLRFRGSAHKAGKVFKKELLKEGLDAQAAEDLTSLYLEGSNIKHFMNGRAS